MSDKYKLSPTERLNYVHKGKLSTDQKMKSVKKIFFTIFLFSILFFILMPYYSRYQRQQAIDQEIETAKAEIVKYEKKNQDLAELVSYLESDQAAEERARVNFGLKKEGETVVVIKRPVGINKDDENIILNDEKNISNFKKWYNYFFNN